MATKNCRDIVAVVTEAIRCHRENGVSLNPYSTDGARSSWQKGFDGKQPALWDQYECYQRGKLCALLLEEGV